MPFRATFRKSLKTSFFLFDVDFKMGKHRGILRGTFVDRDHIGQAAAAFGSANTFSGYRLRKAGIKI